MPVDQYADGVGVSAQTGNAAGDVQLKAEL